MTQLEFTASQVGTDVSFGVVTTGASTALDKEPVQYVSLQIPELASTLEDIYLEVDDQINGSYGNLSRSRLTESQWILELRNPLRTYPGVTKIIVNLSPGDLAALRASLALVAGVADRLTLGVMSNSANYPDAIDASLVGTYPGLTKSGGGFVWDEVLEYRVWCHPERGAPDEEDGDDYYYAFATYLEALRFSQETQGAEEPIALILQRECIGEPEPGNYVHVKEERVTEWPVSFLSRPRRNDRTIPDFLSPDAPDNRLEIIRGISKPK